MPMSAAAIDGISNNGHRWKHRLTSITLFTKELGALNDRLDGRDDHDQIIVPRAESEGAVMDLIKAVRVWIYDNEATLDKGAIDDLRAKLDDLEAVEDCDMAEINYAMGELYDSFDYWRVLVS